MSEVQNEYIKGYYKDKYSPAKKLVITLNDKDHYTLHYRCLQQCLNQGLILEKVYNVLEFDQSPWMEPYISGNTQRRKKAKNAFEKDFWKLMNNSVFGKTMEDVRRRQKIDLVRVIGEERRLRKLLSDPAFIGRKIFYGANLLAVHRKQTNVFMNKPVIVGVSILDLAKYFMYDYWYEHLKKIYGERVKLLYTDTDSLIIEVETDDVYQDMVDHKELYDFSNYPKEHRLRKAVGEDFIEKNKAVIGLFKDESGGRYGEEYAGVRSKAYSFYTLPEIYGSKKGEITEVRKAKGLKKSIVKKDLHHRLYVSCVLEGKEDISRTGYFLRSDRHRMYQVRQTKRSINPLDTKLWLTQDRADALPYGDVLLTNNVNCNSL